MYEAIESLRKRKRKLKKEDNVQKQEVENWACYDSPAEEDWRRNREKWRVDGGRNEWGEWGGGRGDEGGQGGEGGENGGGGKEKEAIEERWKEYE